MKLKNKKTGDIWEFDGGFSMIASHETAERAGGRGCSVGCHANSLAELNEEWEDYKPAEPLIKDEKIRKVVRAWAEMNGVKQVTVERTFCTYIFYPADTGVIYIAVWTEPSLSNLSEDKIYTITELCGEEEE